MRNHNIWQIHPSRKSPKEATSSVGRPSSGCCVRGSGTALTIKAKTEVQCNLCVATQLSNCALLQMSKCSSIHLCSVPHLWCVHFNMLPILLIKLECNYYRFFYFKLIEKHHQNYTNYCTASLRWCRCC